LARFSTDLASLEGWLTGAINGLLLPVLGVLTGMGLLFYLLDWQVALAGTLVWPLVLILPRLIAPRAARAGYEKKQDESEMLSAVEEMIGASRVIKAYGLEAHSRARFESRLGRLAGSAGRAAFLGSMVERATVVTIYGVQVMAVAVGAWLAYTGRVTVGALVAFLTIFWNLGWSLVVMGRSAPAMVAAASSMRRVDELLDEKTDAGAAPSLVALHPLRDAIRFNEVGFSYRAGEPVLRGAAFEITRGQSVAFVGPSGSGKSTVLNLLARFYEPTEGKVLFDDIDTQTATARSQRAMMGIVLQDTFLFNTSIRDNILLGRLDATQSDVEAAAKAAEIHDTILAMPRGYDTAVGERGGNLSGGQRQRISLARALLRDPAVLLLDEVTAALDPGAEAAINETLARAGKGRTTVSVTHRLAGARGADCIFVIDRGVVVEQGRHDALVARSGVYAKLWRKQSGFVVTGDGHSAMVTVDRLREIPLLQPLEESQLQALTGLFVCERATAGQVIVAEGEVGSLFYLLVRGQVSVSRLAGGAEPVNLGVLEDGDQFGELALLYDAPRNATVTARTDCLLLTLTRQHFLDLLAATPSLRVTVERIAAERAQF
jgi:ATP-binding cassette subfamily B protein